MDIKALTPELSVTSQLTAADVEAARNAGFHAIVCNRPDGESADQTPYEAIESAATRAGMTASYLPVVSGKILDGEVDAFERLMKSLPGPVLAYCKTGSRSAALWALGRVKTQPLTDVLATAKKAGVDLQPSLRRLATGGKATVQVTEASHDIVIVGAGAAGIATASSLLAREPNLDIALIDPAETHYYQPGWTMVGAGIFEAPSTARPMSSLIPGKAKWIKAEVLAFEPEQNAVILQGSRIVKYKYLIVCPGLTLNWQGVEGLVDALGHDGVTSNYRYDLAPYTWKLVQALRGGRAVFTQPGMPIKCAGAPQKAMYLSADHWRKTGVLKNIDISFYNAGAVLFGVAAYVPALMEYIALYGVDLEFSQNLVSIDGTAKKATFVKTLADGTKENVVADYDMIHVTPPQQAPAFVRASPLADAAGWVDVDPATLRHKRFENIFSLGDAGNTSNAKTAAAARKQAPVVAHNLLAAMGKAKGAAQYNGYGSCPLTVERGKIVLAEFLYGGKVAPSFPSWLIDGTKPSRAAWMLKEQVLPPLYWNAMLKGREWMAQPEVVA
jgi:sulfide:quinone oxidoreductase